MSQTIDMEKLKRIYALPSWGYSDAELAERFKTTRNAIYKARKRLEDDGIVFETPHRGKHRINRKQFLANIALKPEESTFLLTQALKSVRQNTLSKKHSRNALEKLSLAMYQPMAEQLVRAVTQLPDTPNAEKRDKIFEVLVRAWTEQSKVRIWYTGLKSDTTLVHGVSPYLIQPSPWSDSVYLVGYSDVMEKIVPFKIERIKKAVLTSEPPKLHQFDEDELFRYAWGIWRTDKEPETVKLRFTGTIAIRRLRESIWHPLEEVMDQNDGSVLWIAPISEPMEMLPWIRGWGVDCEVLEPDWLRAKIEGEASKLAKLYGWHTTRSNIIDGDNTSLEQTFTDFFGD